MKKQSFSLTARAKLSTLFFISSVVLFVLALNTDVLEIRGASAKQTRRPLLLLGPSRSAEPYESRQSVAPNSPLAPAAVPAAPTPPTPVYIGFENFEAPGTLIQVASTSQGPSGHTVEYIGHDAGEPSIGVNWNSTQDPAKGVTAYQSDLQTDFVKFDDSCFPGGQKASWYNSQAPTSQFIDSDPIGFVDAQTGRVFCGQLSLTTPGCKISFTDTDGLDPLSQPGPDGWVGTTGPAGSGIDHETIGGGPHHAPLVDPPAPAYAHAVYYCSQDLGPAFCLRSDDGGTNWVGPFELSCGSLHGHVKVAPDGTVYVPNNDCGGEGAVLVSTDNGVTWTTRPVSGTTSGFSDPAVSIDNNGRAYFVIANGDGTAVVATSGDQGQTWENVFDVGAVYGVKTTAFPAAVAGDAGRAAVSFYGSTTAGSGSDHSFNGIWHLYVAETFDGGVTWTTVDATPNAPVQRGCIWNGGGVDICRNLLDFFDMTVDKQGRVEVGYVSGCAGGNCMQAAATAFGNAYTATATIARQSSGKRMFAINDPPATTVPGMPFVSQRRVGRAIHLAWSEADTGNSPITGYRIMRGISSGSETLLTTVTGTQTGGTFDDLTATDTTQTYYYKVLALNAVGASCGNNEISAPYIGTGCTGLIVQKTPPGHPEQTAQGQAPASLAIDYVAVGEPPNTSNLMFQMKVTSLSGTLPPDSRWRIVWDSYKSSGQQFYVGMKTDQNSAPTFDYGEVMTGSIPPVVGLIGVPMETFKGAALPASNKQSDGTITIFVPKSAVGDPQPGDLLGAVCGRTFTGDTPETVNLERSTALVDHTFVKAQRDNGSPAATYTILGNSACEGGIVPVSAVSRKTHTGAGDFDVVLPLTGAIGIECRKGQGASSNDHKVVVTFATPVTFTSASVTSGAGSVASSSASGNQITVNLTGITNAQRIAITLVGVNDGTNIGNVTIPMGVLLGDTNASSRVDGSDVSLIRQQNFQTVNDNTGTSNFREDVNVSGRIDGTDVSIARQQNFTVLPP